MQPDDGKELEDFVSGTLLSILRGVKKASEEVAKEGGTLGAVNPTDSLHPSTLLSLSQSVSFDVAVTASSGKSAGGGAGIKVLSVGVDAKGTIKADNSRVSRISFSVPVLMNVNKIEDKTPPYKSSRQRDPLV